MSRGDKERIAERRKKAIQLRVEGCTYAEIGEELGCCEATAYGDVKAVLEQTAKEAREAATEVIAVELQRLDVATKLALREIQQANNIQAIDRLVKVQERRAKLLGLDSPDRHEVATSELSPDAVASLTRQVFSEGVAPKSNEPDDGPDDAA